MESRRINKRRKEEEEEGGERVKGKLWLDEVS